MTLFKNHIKQCINNKKNINVEIGHLESITFDDICALIYLLSETKTKIILSDRVKTKLCIFENDYFMPDVDNIEQLAILRYLSEPNQDNINVNRIHEPHRMSTDFIILAECAAVDHYPITNDIIYKFKIGFEPDRESAKKCFHMYIESD